MDGSLFAKAICKYIEDNQMSDGEWGYSERDLEAEESREILGLSVPVRATSIAIKVLAVLAVLYTLYYSRSLVLPIVVAAFIAMFCSRLVCFLKRLGLPKFLGAALVILALIAGLGYGGGFLAEPAVRWLGVMPSLGEEIIARINGLSEPFMAVKEAVVPSGEAGGGEDSIVAAVDSALSSMLAILAQSTLYFVVQLGAVIVITYFFLVFGHDLMLGLVRAQKTFSDKRRSVFIFDAIREDITRYVSTIAIINMGLGLVVGLVMHLIGVEDAFLWGALAGVLNFAPYLGPMIMASILTVVGFVEFSTPLTIAMVPGLFLLINFIECQFVTPTALGRRFNMNPLVVVLWLFAWGWLWGPVGMLIAIPLLVCFKIVATNLDLVGDWVRLLDGPVLTKQAPRIEESEESPPA